MVLPCVHLYFNDLDCRYYLIIYVQLLDSFIKNPATKLNYWYDTTGKWLPNHSASLTNYYVNGYVRDSLVFIFGTLIVLTLITLVSVPFSFNFKI